ncbi:MAG: hypothetical protein R3F49_07070 [Planctomycetota bacterium]
MNTPSPQSLLRSAFVSLTLGVLAAPVSAQELRVFELNSATTHWSADSNLGPMGAFLQSYSLSGDIVVDFDVSPVTGRARITGARLVVPNTVVAALLSGPANGTVAFRDLELGATSPDFDLSPGLPGAAFATTLDLVARSGFMRVEPPLGPAFEVDLAGASLGSLPISGSFPSIGPAQGLRVDAFSFDMPFSGGSWSGAFTHDVTSITAASGCPSPESYCPSDPNTLGGGARLTLVGSTSVTTDDFTLQVQGAPLNTFGIAFYGLRAGEVLSGQGRVCVGGPLARLGVVPTGAAGSAALRVMLANQQSGPLALTPGVHAHFQFYHRVATPNQSSWNFTNALAVTLCP